MEEEARRAAASLLQGAQPEAAGAVYGALGNAHRSLGAPRKAIEYHRKHLAIAVEVGDRAGEGRANGNIGNAHDSMGEFREAIEYHRKHLGIAVEVGDRAGEGNACNNLAAALHMSGRPAEAVVQASRALTVFAEVERDVGNDAQRISLFAAGQIKSYCILQAALLETERPGPALAVAELGKARVLSDALGAGAAAALAAGGAEEAQGGAVSRTTPSTTAGADAQEARASVSSSADLAETEWRAVQGMAQDECCVVEYSELGDGECSSHVQP